jgi:hypothetical protein
MSSTSPDTPPRVSPIDFSGRRSWVFFLGKELASNGPSRPAGLPHRLGLSPLCIMAMCGLDDLVFIGVLAGFNIIGPSQLTRNMNLCLQ